LVLWNAKTISKEMNNIEYKSTMTKSIKTHKKQYENNNKKIINK
jgi:hypothetical protein